MLHAIERRLPLWWRTPLEGVTYAEGPFAGLKPLTVVTGGSDGIGLALAHCFAAAGHDLLLIARDAARLHAAAADIHSKHSVQVLTASLDLTQRDALESLDAALARAGGYTHILVNNAAIGLSGPFAEHAQNDLAALLDLNVRAFGLLMHHVLPGMCERGCGGILNLASLGGYIPGPWQAAYYASKAYVLSLSEAVAAEVAPRGVRICALAPGPVETRFHSRMRSESALYRRLLPPLRPETAAWWGYHGFNLGLRVIVPDLINLLAVLCFKLIPHRITIPIVGWLLRPRGRETGDA